MGMSIPDAPPPIPPAPVRSPYKFDEDGAMKKRRSLRRRTDFSSGRSQLNTDTSKKMLLGE